MSLRVSAVPPLALLGVCILAAGAPDLRAAALHRPLAHWTFDDVPPLHDLVSGRPLDGPVAPLPGGPVGRYLPLRRDAAPSTARASGLLTESFTVELLARFTHESALGGRLVSLGERWVVHFNAEGLHFSVRVLGADGTASRESLSVPFDGAGRKSWDHYLDGRWHHFAFSHDHSSRTLRAWVDGESPVGFARVLEPRDGGHLEPPTGPLSLGHRSRPLSMDVDEVAIHGTALPGTLLAQHARDALVGGRRYAARDPGGPAPPTRDLDEPAAEPLDYPPGHPEPTQSVLSQLRSFPLPRYRPGHGLLRLDGWFDPHALGDRRQPGVDRREAALRSRAVQDELCRHWHYHLLVVDNVSAENPLTVAHRLWIGLANEHPEWPTSIHSYWHQARPARAGLGGSRAFVRRDDLPLDHYLNDGQEAILVDGARVVSPEAPLSSWRLDGRSTAAQLQQVLEHLERPLDLVVENGEVRPTRPLPEELLARDPTVARAWREGGLSAHEYQSRAKAAQRIAYRDALLSSPGLEGARFLWYAVDGGEPARFSHATQRAVQRPIEGRLYPTPDFYPRWPGNWRRWRGAWHGLAWIERTRPVEIAAGDSLSWPFVAAGWSADPEDNVRPGQWLGLLKLLAVAGAESYFPGHYATRSPGPAPRHWAWQVTTPALAQAVTSRYEDVLRAGSWARHWAGDPRVVVWSRTAGARTVFVGTLQPSNNSRAQHATRARIVSVPFEGQVLRFEVRRQGSTYVWDRSTRPPTFVQLDGWHQWEHPAHWSEAHAFEAEVDDGRVPARDGSRLVTVTHAPRPPDYSRFTSALSVDPRRGADWGAGAPATRYGFAPRVAGDHAVAVRARTVDGRPARVRVTLDGARALELGCGVGEGWWWLVTDTRTGERASWEDVAAGRHVVTMQPLHDGVEIDRLVIGRDGPAPADTPTASAAACRDRGARGLP